MTATLTAPSIMMLADESPAEELELSLNHRARLGVLKRRVWGSGSKRDEDVTQRVNELFDVEQDAGAYSKKIAGNLRSKTLSPSKRALKDIIDIASQAYAFYKGVTMPWLNNGTRIFASAAYFEIVKKMRDFEDQFAAAVDRFVPLYPDLLNEVSIEHGKAFKLDEYPSPSQIRQCFSMGFASFPLPELSQENDFRRQLGDAEVERIQRENQAMYETAMANAMRDVYRRIIATIGKMAERLRLYEVTPEGTVHPFRDSTIENVEELVELLRMLNVTGDSALDQMTQDISGKLTRYSCDTLRTSDGIRAKVLKDAETIVREAVEQHDKLAEEVGELLG